MNKWGKGNLNTLRQYKPKIITKSIDHFGTAGIGYSFWNRGNYGMINNSLLTTCSEKYPTIEGNWKAGIE